MHVTIWRDPTDLQAVAAALRTDGLAVVQSIRSSVLSAADELSDLLGVATDGPVKDDDYLLLLATGVDPTYEHGWVDYLVYGPAFPRDPRAANSLVCDAVRAWSHAGKPDRYAVQLHA